MMSSCISALKWVEKGGGYVSLAFIISISAILVYDNRTKFINLEKSLKSELQACYLEAVEYIDEPHCVR